MKKYLIVVLATLVATLSSLVFADEKAKTTETSSGERLTRSYINFFNPGDRPPALPFLTITFHNIPKSSAKTILEWREEIEKKLEVKGSLKSVEDVEKIQGVIVEYAPKFTQSGAEMVTLEFPRFRRGILLFKKQ